jgi:anti-sigma regulatory factor (Ser/Thr protein kinase)
VWSFHADRPEDALRARGPFLNALSVEAGGRGFDRFRAQLIFTELVANAIRHASGPVDVQLRCVANKAMLHVFDRGPGFKLDASLPASPLAEGGRGLFLVREFSEKLHVRSLEGHGTCVSAVFSL